MPEARSTAEVELYVYYRVAAESAAATWPRLLAWQEARCARTAGLRARALRRLQDDPAHAEVPGADQTWMEVWQRPGTGVDAALQQALDTEARGVLGGSLVGQRHLERFCAPAPEAAGTVGPRP